jgi:type I restriction enzyme S subunit
MQRLLTKGIGHTEFKDSPLGEIPKSWEVVRLGDLVTKVGSGITPKGGRESYLLKGITFIRSQNVLRGKLKLADVAHISQEQHSQMANSQLESNDVLLNITGASIGRSCLVPESLGSGNVNQHVCIIRTIDKLNSEYLSQFLNSLLGKNQINKFQAGGNREGLNFQQIRSFKIPLPSINEQEKISSILNQVDEKLEVLSEKKGQTQWLKKGLMQQLLTGRVRV